MKLTTVTMVTVDGVLQGLGAADEDRSGGFDRGGWVSNAFDPESMGYLNEVYRRADAFLFGRRTYEIFAGSWGTWADPGDSPVWTALNSKPKYVASGSIAKPEWAGTTVLTGDLPAAVGELKTRPGAELQVHGSGALVRSLLGTGLIDEMILLVCPVIVGQGTRLFPAEGPDLALDLADSRTTPRGVTIQVYRPSGRPRYETATATS